MKLGGSFDIDSKSKKIIQLNESLQDKSVWSDRDKSLHLSKQKSALEKELNEYDQISSDLTQLKEFKELYDEDQSLEFADYLNSEIKKINISIQKLSFIKIFNGKLDNSNAFVDIQSGSGGTEAQDWAEMLLRMYSRWGEKHDFDVETIDITSGDVAGIKSATLKFNGQYAFGWLKTETGVHRLVRKSPFDSGNRRHTSFASVFVSPEINDDIEIEIDPSVLLTLYVLSM